MSTHSGFFKGDNHVEVMSVIANCGTDTKRARDALIIYILAKQRKGKSAAYIEGKLTDMECSFGSDPSLHSAFHKARSKTGMPPSQVLPSPPPGIMGKASVGSRPSGSDYHNDSSSHPSPAPALIATSVSAPSPTYWRLRPSNSADGPAQVPHIQTEPGWAATFIADSATSVETSRRRGNTYAGPSRPPSYMTSASQHGSGHPHVHQHNDHEYTLTLANIGRNSPLDVPWRTDALLLPIEPLAGLSCRLPTFEHSDSHMSGSEAEHHSFSRGIGAGNHVLYRISEDLEFTMSSLSLPAVVRREIIKCVFCERGYDRERWSTVLGECGLDSASAVYLLEEMDREVAYRGSRDGF
ncbi:hypothetical protein CONPUDRAFT_160836 [Coniophora puteana RWD-64-598 SS2]|uniref:Uncharacterized protein n=1 Tax=Coniophora puteana (strain RWD-64-598) TaxID=741705 RepID=A0A5M3N4Y6_CONPW|nr:uncharacterized protein CONPUDRAFT_160836 [Coniophora puteana RWD-64-598 SS2]EIW85915.1 hypothetical protein CONPUDRAFT_160836 [Coniophora puteana RWD-64-598 SS2]